MVEAQKFLGCSHSPGQLKHRDECETCKAEDAAAEEKTDVIFRWYRASPNAPRFIEDRCLAVFPGIAGTSDVRTCMNYQHIGQHGHGEYAWVIRITRPATEEESKALREELTRIGYKLREVKRETAQHRRERAGQVGLIYRK